MSGRQSVSQITCRGPRGCPEPVLGRICGMNEAELEPGMQIAALERQNPKLRNNLVIVGLVGPSPAWGPTCQNVILMKATEWDSDPGMASAAGRGGLREWEGLDRKAPPPPPFTAPQSPAPSLLLPLLLTAEPHPHHDSLDSGAPSGLGCAPLSSTAWGSASSL